MELRSRVALGAGCAVCTAVVAAAIVLSPGAGRGAARLTPARRAPVVRPARRAPADPPTAIATPTIAGPTIALRVGAGGPGRRIPAGFLGFSFEFQAVRAYTGSDPSRIDPVLVQLIRNLTPGQAPVIRIGGDSTDDSYVPGPSVAAPPYVAYHLTPSWMATTAALAHALGARMILGVNLAADDPRLAAAEGRDYLDAFGARSIEALEIGNEPNLYHTISLLHTVAGAVYRTRPPSYEFAAFEPQFDALAKVLPPLALAGPALAVGPSPTSDSWRPFMPSLLHATPRLKILTIHRYPLRNCNVDAGSPEYPTIPHLLSPYATSKFAGDVRPWVTLAHAHGALLRVDELNSVACRGRTGVSDTFASALWVTDALFSLAAVGVDGVDMHTLPNTAYELFRFEDAGGRWSGHVAPVYYGLQLFAQAAPAGSRLLHVSRDRPSSGLSVWATLAGDRRTRVVLINKDPGRAVTVALSLHGPSASATIDRMTAPDVAARRDVTLGGAGYGAETVTGVLPPMSTPAAARDRAGAYVVTVPGASAALVTVTR
jgi:hypothetical protein